MTSIPKISALLFCLVLLSVSLTGCLDGNDAETIYNNLQDATVKSFSFEDNSDVCSSLSGYKFTIDNFGTSDPDLTSKMAGAGVIFNPDSLPLGAEPDSITILMECTKASSAIFSQYDAEGNLKNMVNYSDTQYVSFNDYAVTRLDVVSYDGQFKKSYFIKVNVHKAYGDTIRWQYKAKDLWETVDVVDQNTIKFGESLLWFVKYSDGSVKLSKTDKSNITGWSQQTVVETGTQPLELSTMYVWQNRLYAVAEDGKLMSTENGESWHSSDVSLKFENILGVQYATKQHGEYLHAIVRTDDALCFATSFDGEKWEVGEGIPENFPVKNYSVPISVSAKPAAGNVTSRLYIVGGETADGIITSSTWSCDGTSWAEFQQPFLPAMSRPAIIQYTLNADAPNSLWLLWPGILANGEVSNTLYFSENKGVTWKPMTNEYAKYAKTSKISSVGAVSAYLDEDNYWMYFLGGVDGEGKQVANIFGGQLLSLTFDKQK